MENQEQSDLYCSEEHSDQLLENHDFLKKILHFYTLEYTGKFMFWKKKVRENVFVAYRMHTASRVHVFDVFYHRFQFNTIRGQKDIDKNVLIFSAKWMSADMANLASRQQ